VGKSEPRNNHPSAGKWARLNTSTIKGTSIMIVVSRGNWLRRSVCKTSQLEVRAQTCITKSQGQATNKSRNQKSSRDKCSVLRVKNYFLPPIIVKLTVKVTAPQYWSMYYALPLNFFSLKQQGPRVLAYLVISDMVRVCGG